MNKKLIIMAFSLVMLSGCANNNTAEVTTIETASDTSIETTVETTVETTETITSAEETTVTEDTTIEETTAGTLEETVVESDFWTEEQIQEQLGTEYDLTNFICTHTIERGGAKLVAFVEDVERMPVTVVVYCKPDKTIDVLHNDKDMFTPFEYDSTTFADFQYFDNTLFLVKNVVVGNCLPVFSWYLTEEGTIIDLADTIDFETQYQGLFMGGIETEDGYKTVIGLREHIPNMVAAGASQLLPVTLENEVIVKLDMEPITD